eukprot:1000293-Prymnesium_polylepis.1
MMRRVLQRSLNSSTVYTEYTFAEHCISISPSMSNTCKSLTRYPRSSPCHGARSPRSQDRRTGAFRKELKPPLPSPTTRTAGWTHAVRVCTQSALSNMHTDRNARRNGAHGHIVAARRSQPAPAARLHGLPPNRLVGYWNAPPRTHCVDQAF